MVRLARMSLLAGCLFFFANYAFAGTGGSCPASVPSGITQCFYADYTNGADSNSGITESAALQHLPGMTGCTKNCSAIIPTAGQGFILRGGTTWPNAALGWYWIWSGTGSTSSPGCTGSGCIYIGIDPNWHSGSAWTRPILNAEGKAVTNTSGTNNTLFGCYCNYAVFDNIELTGLYWTGTPGYGSSVNIALAGGSPGIGMHDTFEHLYVHGWIHDPSASEAPCGFDGDTGDPNNNAGTIIEYSVFDGTDTDQKSCNGALFGGPPYIAYNVFNYVSSAMILASPISIHDNLIQNVVHSFNTAAHENALEENYSQNTLVYNNVFRHIGNGALTLWLAPDAGYTAYVFNNVIYDTDISNVIDLAASLKTSPSGNIAFWNNTVECGQDSNPNAICVANINSAITSVTLQNNHFITNAANFWSTNGPTPTLSHNLLQAKNIANGQGYTSAEVYAFSPTSAYPANSTPGQGTVATSLCTASGATACSNDTSYGVAYDTTSHTVSLPGRKPLSWRNPPDIGAYAFGGGPATPQGLTGTAVIK